MFKKENLMFLGSSNSGKTEVDVFYNIEELKKLNIELFVGVKFDKTDYRYFNVQDEYKCSSNPDKNKLHKILITRFEEMKENINTSMENLINEFNSVKEWSDFKDDFARLEEREETSAFERALEEELKREEKFDIISEILEDKPVRKAKKSVKKTTKKATKKSTAKKDEVIA